MDFTHYHSVGDGVVQTLFSLVQEKLMYILTLILSHSHPGPFGKHAESKKKKNETFIKQIFLSFPFIFVFLLSFSLYYAISSQTWFRCDDDDVLALGMEKQHKIRNGNDEKNKTSKDKLRQCRGMCTGIPFPFKKNYSLFSSKYFVLHFLFGFLSLF